MQRVIPVRQTSSNLQLWAESNMLAHFHYSVHCSIVAKAFDMKHKDSRQRFDEHLLLRFNRNTRSCSLRDLHGLRMRNVGKGVLYSVYQFSLKIG